MRPEELQDAIGRIDDKLIETANQAREMENHTAEIAENESDTETKKTKKQKNKKRKKTVLLRWGIAAAAACLLFTMRSPRSGDSGDMDGVDRDGVGIEGQVVHAAVIAEAQYPEMAPYPQEEDFVKPGSVYVDKEAYQEAYNAWRADIRRQKDQPDGYGDTLDGFMNTTIRSFLTDTQGENRVYSPANVYMALSMLAELTEGESRQQILEVLQTEDMDSLRDQVSCLWNANYQDDGAVRSLMANSIWLDQQVAVNQETMNTLASEYYASSYQGEMGSEAMNQALQSWLNEQTDGLLSDSVKNVQLDSNTLLALASTISFRDKWANQFSEGATVEDIFHGAAGDVTCDFMHDSEDGYYFYGDTFGAVYLTLENGNRMWLILPDEGVSVDQVLEQEDILSMIRKVDQWENKTYIMINLAVPKFDVMSSLDLQQELRELGVTDVFDSAAADFSPVTTNIDGGIYVTGVSHTARVTIDEKGCTAVAYTVIPAAGDAMPPEEEEDFVLNRPFLFVLTGDENVPLFAGVVNTP